MKRGIRLEFDYNGVTTAVDVSKARGKLTIDEIIDAIVERRMYGHYVILLNCSAEAAEGQCYNDDEPEGDFVRLFPIDENDKCPVCQQLTPLLEYCQECGAKLKQRDMR